MTHEPSGPAFEPTPDLFEYVRKHRNTIIIGRMAFGFAQRLMGYVDGGENTHDALQHRSEAEIQVLRANLPAAVMQQRLVRADELIATPADEKNATSPVVVDRARVLLALAHASINVIDPDYHIDSFPLTFNDLLTVGVEAMNRQEIGNAPGAAQADLWMARVEDINDAVRIASDAFVTASMEAQLGQ